MIALPRVNSLSRRAH